MNIEVERTPEALDQCHRASLRLLVVIAGGDQRGNLLLDLAPSNGGALPVSGLN